jgi:UPF0716 family protein affecting phage T7 exclusion
MWRKFRHWIKEIKRVKPGRRFQKQYERGRQKNDSALRHTVFIVLGSALVITGFLLSIPPGVPGFLVSLAGLALIAARWHFLAKLLDKAELYGRSIIQRVRDRKNK